MDAFMESLGVYYGLDWIGLILWQIGFYLVTSKNKWGFPISILSCFCGFYVAYVGDLYAYIVNNMILIAVMTKGFIEWSTPKMSQQVQPAE